MSSSINIFIIIMLLAVTFWIVLLTLKAQFKQEKKKRENKKREHLHLDYLEEEIKEMMYQLTTNQIEELSGREEIHQREINKRIELKKALKNCNNGSMTDKRYIIDFIGDLLSKYLINKEEINQVLFFDKPSFLSTKDMWDILLFIYKKKYGAKGLEKLIAEENWDKPREVDDEEGEVYRIEDKQVRQAYILRRPVLKYEDKVSIIAEKIYESYKGFGAVDKLRDMEIDGISGGVSGIIDLSLDSEEVFGKNQKLIPRNYDSIWIFYKGKSIHMSFLSFGSEKELKRICQNIYRYNKAGQLSETIGYKVNEMYDGSRVVVVRPPFSESWAFFVRKFHLSNLTLADLFKEEGSQDLVTWLKYMMKGARITAITGAQGSGKTTLLMGMIRHIDPTLTLRVQELAFELHLRKLYPRRNILTFKETDSISGQEGLDLQKKTDGSVNILGEIATDEVSVLMLQMAQVASLFTVFTHHAKTMQDLVLSLRNSLLKCDVFRDETIAEEQVVRVLDYEVHMDRDYTGHRFIDRISEIVPKGKTYRESRLIVYENGKYVFKDPPTQEQIRKMCQLMKPGDLNGFLEFIKNRWGEEFHADICDAI